VKGSSWHALPDMIVILDLFGGLAFHLGRFGLHFFFGFRGELENITGGTYRCVGFSS
jgi:hypothetical protein